MRRKDREITDAEKIRDILEKSKIVHLALMDGDRPYVLDMHYGFEFEEGSLVLYMHSAKEGKKLDLIRKDGNAAIVLECDIEDVSGGDIPCKYGSKYASVMAQGTIEIVEESEEKKNALVRLMFAQTGRAFEINDAMAASVAVLKFTADSYTAKANV